MPGSHDLSEHLANAPEFSTFPLLLISRVRSIPGARALTAPLPGSVVTAGTFDGVHLGHCALVERAVERARALGLPAVAYTFDPHPAKVIAAARAPAVLISIEERVRLLGERGIELVVVEPFDPPFSLISADEWIEQYLVRQLAPRHVVVGFNFFYGHRRGGSPAHLVEAGRRLGFTVDVMGPVELEGAVVSSSRVRELIERGEVERAAVLLGRPFALTGRVETGDRRGRTIGFPTANLAPDAEVLPAPGVYAGIATLEDGGRFRAVINIGARPTFEGSGVRVEAHLLGFDGDLYGRPLRLELAHRLREERRFDGVDALVAQIRRDIDEAQRRVAVT